MAKVTAPLLSFGGSGSIAQSMVFSKWKGRPYVRRHVIPANPQTVAQTLTRDIFRNLSSIWLNLQPNGQAPWDRFAEGQVLTGRNAYMGKNLAVLRGEVDLANWISSPGAKGGLVQDSTVLTPGVATITVDVVTPTPPTGWVVVGVQANMIVDGAPESITDFATIAGQDLVTPYSIILTGVAVTAYAVAAWVVWSKPDNSLAYGPSVSSVATTL